MIYTLIISTGYYCTYKSSSNVCYTHLCHEKNESESLTVIATDICVCKVFKKYRVSFCRDKGEFLKKIVEYVGRDILCHENFPAQSRFNLFND